MLPQPRSSKKSKRSSKRAVSAPQKGLLTDVHEVAAPMETIEAKDAIQMSSGSDEILDLFDFAPDSPVDSDHHGARSGSADILDLFNNLPPTKPQGLRTTNGRNTVTALAIDPKLLQQRDRAQNRESRSLYPDKWAQQMLTFDENKGSSSPKPQQNHNGTQSAHQNFEAVSKSAEKAVDDEKTPSKPTFISKPSPKPPRASKRTSSMKAINENGNENEEDDDSKKNGISETNALEELHRGAALLKYPRRSGFPHFKHIQLSVDNLRIEWFSKRKKPDQTCIWIKDIREVVRGQETEVFKKFHQKTLEKSSFSIVYGPSYRTLDVAAKSIDECEMWVKCILKLVDVYKAKKRESDLTAVNELFVGILFKDRNRPMSRQGSGNFIRANSSKNLKIDPVALKEIEKDMESLSKTYAKTIQMSQKPLITKSNQYSNIQYVLSELEERIEELTYEVANIRDTELAKREVWRANVDLSAIQEKVEVLLKHLGNKSDRRRSNFI